MNLEHAHYDAIVIGGGFYGCCLALFLREHVGRVLVIEKESDLLTRASYANQARVHNGYHYPRSFITALRSRINFPRFVLDFRKAVDSSFEKIYAVARTNSKVNARQFHKFCTDIGADISATSPAVKKLFNDQLIESAFTVKEYAFNAVALREILKEKLVAAGVEVVYQTHATKIVKHVVTESVGESIEIVLNDGTSVHADRVFNCAYSQINTILENSGLARLPFKHEITEMALIEMPPELKKVGITIMDGPFFSVMPFPARDLHTLSHVRYTPHYSWMDHHEYRNAHEYLAQYPKHSNYVYMLKDAQRFIPSLVHAEYRDSLFEVKTVLVENERDDGRPILLRHHYGMRNFSVIMGGKIDNIYDILEALRRLKEYVKTE